MHRDQLRDTIETAFDARDGVTPDEGVEVSGATLLAMARLDFDDPAVRAEARPLMKRVLHERLGGRGLNSRALFGALGEAGAAPDASGD